VYKYYTLSHAYVSSFSSPYLKASYCKLNHAMNCLDEPKSFQPYQKAVQILPMFSSRVPEKQNTKTALCHCWNTNKFRCHVPLSFSSSNLKTGKIWNPNTPVSANMNQKSAKHTLYALLLKAHQELHMFAPSPRLKRYSQEKLPSM
jgi:hypothetical protein